MPDNSKQKSGPENSAAGSITSSKSYANTTRHGAVPTQQDIEEAHTRIKPYIHQTPVLSSRGIDELIGGELFFKCENLQKVGAFKARGAMNAVLSLTSEDLAKGVATHSSGNHAQALARAAKIVHAKSFIVMPSTSP